MNDTPGKTLSSLTGGDKQHPKLGRCVGVFFQMFDWNKKFTGKKLFSNRLLPAERPKQVSKKYNDEKLPMAKLLLIADENRGGFPNTKKNSSSVCPTSEGVHCSSSKEGNGNSANAPGVVARLMGLETLPPSDLHDHGKEANTKPFETRPLPELMNQRKHGDYFHDEQLDQFNSGKYHAKLNGLIKKPVESRPQKLQKTGQFEKRPVPKFQPDNLPFKSILSPKAHNKLVSPIKSPGLLSAKNAARLMEAAAKILEPGLQTNSRARNPLIRSSVARPLLKDQESDERKTALKRSSRVQEPLRKSVDSNAIKLLKGQALSKSWNGKEDAECSKPNLEQNSRKYFSPARENSACGVQDTGKRKSKLPIPSAKQDGTGVTSRVQTKLVTSKPAEVKKQEKTLSLALEAKANVQRREFQPLNASSSNACSLRNKKSFNGELEVSKEQQLFVQENDRKIERKQCPPGIARVAKQNLSMPKPSNQLLSREKVLCKTDRCNDQANKALSTEPSSRHIHRNLQGKKDSAISNRIATGNLRSNNNNARNFGPRKYGCKDKEDKKKTEIKKGDSSSVAKFSPTKKRPSDGHLTSDNTCIMESVSEDESSVFVERSEKKGHSKNVKEIVLKGKGSCGNYSEQQYLDNAENVGEVCKRGQQNAQKDLLSCSKSIDVVSFTFSSPMRSTGRSQAGMHMMEKKLGQGEPFDDWKERQTAHWSDPQVDSEPEKVISEVPHSSSSSFKPSIPGGDTLNALLEQKLRELTSGGQGDLGTGNSKDSVSSKTTASILQDLILALNTGRLAGYDQNTDLLTGSSDLNEAGESSLISEGNSETFQVKDKEHNFAAIGEATSFLGADHVPPRSRVALADMKDSGDAAENAYGEDCDQPSPVSILEFSFSNESCNSIESSDSTHDEKLQLLHSSVQNRAGQVCLTDRHCKFDSDAELCDSASSANLELVESNKIMDAILDISRLHKIDPSLIGLEKAVPACLEDRELDYVREIIGNAELMSEDIGILSEEDVPDFLVDPNLFDKLETQESSSGDIFSNHLKNGSYTFGFRKTWGSWQSRKLLFDCVKHCISSKYSSRYKGGYRTWIKGPTCLEGEKLTGEILGEIRKWRMMDSGMLDDIVEKDMGTPTGKWIDFEREIFEIGAEIEKNICIDLIEELTNDLLGIALT
ncbi:hypothetical protein KI387_010534 [Taxus chinensis]|uniref:DUF4378 domain-containing protein n=1 Tax=Taxus chinensis TaxID=29808 RepID=A0AA38FL03_TAXCH|nr:hypothetical protein KI387_010534 [Taxus chinensis]